jgi:hypothetical protein
MYHETNDNNNNIVIQIGKKLYEEKDYPLESRIISEDKDNRVVQRESRWSGEIKGFNSFPDGNLQGSGISYIHGNGVSISHWQGTFIPINSSSSNESTTITFKGQDTNTNKKFIVIRTFFSNNNEEFRWLDGLICIAEGIFDLKDNCFKSTGYEWAKNKT